MNAGQTRHRSSKAMPGGDRDGLIKSDAMAPKVVKMLSPSFDQNGALIISKVRCHARESGHPTF
jgi:hypothetical protein